MDDYDPFPLISDIALYTLGKDFILASCLQPLGTTGRGFPQGELEDMTNQIQMPDKSDSLSGTLNLQPIDSGTGKGLERNHQNDSSLTSLSVKLGCLDPWSHLIHVAGESASFTFPSVLE